MPPYDALVGSGPSYCIGSLCSTVRLLAPGHAQVRAQWVLSGLINIDDGQSEIRLAKREHSSSPPA